MSINFKILVPLAHNTNPIPLTALLQAGAREQDDSNFSPGGCIHADYS